MPNEIYFDKAEKLEGCKCKAPKDSGNGLCFNCGGAIEILPEKIINDEDEKFFGTFYGKNLWPKGRSEKKFIVERLIYENDTTCFLGRAGIGKSVFTWQLASSLTSGQHFLEAYPISEKKRVALFQLEGEREETYERAMNMVKAVSFDESNFVHVFLPSVHMDTKQGFELAMDSLRDPVNNKFISGYDVIMFDPLYMTLTGDPKQNHIATAWCENMRKIKGEFGNAGIVVIGHPNKEQFYNGEAIVSNDHPIPGSQNFNNFFNTIYHYSYDKSKKLHHLEIKKDRSNKCVKAMTLKMIEPSPLYYTIMGNNGKCEVTVLSQLLITYIREHYKVTRRQMLEEFVENNSYSESSVDKSIKKLKECNTIVTIREDGQMFYQWALELEKNDD